MEVIYRRHFNQSYAILSGRVGKSEMHELSILAYNKVPGLLVMETEIADGITRYWYDITGRQTMEDYLERKQVDKKLLLRLFTALEDICGELEKYLLDENRIVLDPEYLYLDFECRKLEFVYLPDYQKDIRESFRELMEIILRKLNHSDKEATELAYEMYEQSLQGEETLFQMLKKGMQVSAEERDWKRGCEAEAFPEWELAIKSSTAGEPAEDKAEDEMADRINYKNSGRELLSGLLKRRIGDTFRKKEPESLPFVTADDDEPVYPTEILSKEQIVQGIMKYKGHMKQADIIIDRPAFLIGKNANEVDGVIEGKSISRIHAKIERIEDTYYIEDMNSTNGTWLNGIRLEYRQKEPLMVGDRILIGGEEYTFV